VPLPVSIGRRALCALLVLLVVAGCGGGGDGDSGGAASPAEGNGTASPAEVDGATVWVTRDAGAEVVLTASVPAGDSVLQALDRHADVETAYGGRFVQAVNGIEGSLDEQRDWFFFVNGIEPGVGAAEVELGEGDVAWWDYRDWSEQMAAPVVVGAFPEPFLHGWEGRRRPAEVDAPAALEAEANALLRVLGGSAGEGEPNVFRLEVEAGATGATLTARRGPGDGSPVTFTLAGSEEAVRAAATALAADPAIVRFRYTASFDERGEVVE
jgi:Domain of unknown function (DUF4430)